MLVLYRDNTIKFTQLYRLTTGEWYEELKEDLENLLSMQVQIESITCDRHKALLKAIKEVCWQAALQQSLLLLQAHSGNKRNYGLNVTNHFWHHYPKSS